MIRLILFTLLFASTLFAETTLQIGYDTSAMSSYNKKDMKIATDVWLQELMKGIEYDVNFIYYDDMSKMAEDLRKGELDYMTGFGLNFVKYFDLSELEDAFGQGYHDGKDETFIVLASNESGINSWKDVNEHTKIAVEENDDIVKIYVKMKRYETFQTTKANFLDLESRNKTILKLFFKKADMAIATNRSFNLLKELNPQIGKKIKIIDNTGLTSNGFGFFRKSLDPKIKKELMITSNNLAKNEYGKQLLAIYKTETIVDTKVEELKPIEELYKKFLEIEREKN